jgi:hypothetical protein
MEGGESGKLRAQQEAQSPGHLVVTPRSPQEEMLI